MKKHLRLFQVDAFASEVFRGNPAAICPLDEWLPDSLLQAIAEENNLAETAFFVPAGSAYHLRWFTPRYEVPLCGHATLAAAFVLFTTTDPSPSSLTFTTMSGELHVLRSGDLLTLDFPAVLPRVCDTPPPSLLGGLGARPAAVLCTEEDPNYLVVLEREADVVALRPQLGPWEELHPHGVVVTAPGDQVDFVSRYFAPSYGIPEDPVTGSVHCALTPYWAGRLGKRRLHAHQLSHRGGEMACEYREDRVALSGRAVLYLTGEIYL